MAQFPHWTQTVSTGTKSSTVFRAIVTNYALMQSNLRKSMLPYESMEGFIKGFSVTNRIVTSSISHDDIIKTASQHHNKLHATSHLIGTDSISLATSTVAGLMSTTQFNKQETIATMANSRKIKVSKYIGNWDPLTSTQFISLAISLNFRPRYIKIFRSGSHSVSSVYELIDGNAKVIKHQASTLAHKPVAASHIVVNNTGFTVKREIYDFHNTYQWIAME